MSFVAKQGIVVRLYLGYLGVWILLWGIGTPKAHNVRVIMLICEHCEQMNIIPIMRHSGQGARNKYKNANKTILFDSINSVVIASAPPNARANNNTANTKDKNNDKTKTLL